MGGNQRCGGVAFEEIPQRELREHIKKREGFLVGIGVAFKEIPQRELRVRMPWFLPPHRQTHVAFKEIPQRELRDATLTDTMMSDGISPVAFEEILQRELRACLSFQRYIGYCSLSCNKRNPTKGIERGMVF